LFMDYYQNKIKKEIIVDEKEFGKIYWRYSTK
jgi:hypothetical protein